MRYLSHESVTLQPDLTFNWHYGRFLNGGRDGSLLRNCGLSQAPQGTQWGCGGELRALGKAGQRGTRQSSRGLPLTLRGQPRSSRLQQGRCGLRLARLTL
jgi:hypothetical protein